MGLDQRLLDGVLGRREVVPATDEDTEHLRGQLPQQRFVHSSPVLHMTGRTSSHSWIGLLSLPGADETRAATS